MTSKTKQTPTVVALDDGTLDQASGGAWYAKFDGIDGSAKGLKPGDILPKPLALKPLG